MVFVPGAKPLESLEKDNSAFGVLIRWLLAGELLDSFRMDPVYQKDQALIKSLEVQSHPQPPGRGQRLEIEAISSVHWFNQSCLHNAIPINKSLTKEVQSTTAVVKASMHRKGSAPQLHGDRSSCVWDFSRYHSMYLFICTLYDKPVIVSKVFPWVLEPF